MPVSQLVHIQGSFPTHWLGNLSTSLALAGISVHSLRGERALSGDWQVDLELSGINIPSSEKLRDMANQRSVFSSTGPLEITVYQLTRRTSSLHLSLIGIDRIGFLAQLSLSFASLALFPTQVDVCTQGGRALDTFVLHSIGKGVPQAATEEALDRLLRGWYRRQSIRP